MDFTINGLAKGINWESGEEVKSLYEQLKQLKDKRKRRGIRYPLAGAVGVIGGGEVSGQGEVRGGGEWGRGGGKFVLENLSLKGPETPQHTNMRPGVNQ